LQWHAVYNALERMGGTLKGGQQSSVWVRATVTFRRIDGKWFDVHDHISVPVDFKRAPRY
jgi:ketosteroid isomerase-like protein